MAVTKEELQKRLLKYFDGDMDRLKALAKGCNAIGFKVSENIEAISEKPEEFVYLITLSDLGILPKLADTLEKLRK